MAGQPEVVRSLVKAGARVDAKNSDGSTALHGGVFFGQAEAVKLLIDSGADVTIANRSGDTPLRSAESEWNPRSVQGLAAALQLRIDLSKVEQGRDQIADLLRATPNTDTNLRSPN